MPQVPKLYRLEFLNYKNELVKYKLRLSCQCAIHANALLYQREPGEFLCECKPYTVFKSQNKLKGELIGIKLSHQCRHRW